MKFLVQKKVVFRLAGELPLLLKAGRSMPSMVRSSLGLAILFSYIHVHALIYKTQIWKHKDDGHIVATLGDVHLDDCRSAEQQYDIIKMLARIKNSCLICEDPVDSFAGFCLGSDAKYQNVKGMYIWAKLAGCHSIDVEFRLPHVLERAPSYARRVLENVEEIKSFDDEYNSVYEEALLEFGMYGRPLLLELRQDKFRFTLAHCAQRRIMEAHGLLENETHFARESKENCLLDAKILHQIAESRKNKEPAIISAGGWHIANIGRVLERSRYICLTETENPYVQTSLADGTFGARDQACKGKYKTFFDPVSIPDVYQAVEKHALENHAPLLRTQTVLSYLQLRGKIEASPVGYACYRARPILRVAKALPLATAIASVLLGGLLARSRTS